MRHWQPALATDRGPPWLAGLIGHVGEAAFGQSMLDDVQDLLPTASWSVYRAGRTAAPALFLSASRGVADTTRDCWCVHLSGPHRHDRILQRLQQAASGAPLLCHITADEVPPEHRAEVYEAHGVAERVSVLERQAGGAVSAVNFYRHRHQRSFTDAAPDARAGFDQRRQRLCPTLTDRERAVCVRMLQGMTLEGIAADLGLALPTVKTYRGRAFDRLGIHFRNELFAQVLAG